MSPKRQQKKEAVKRSLEKRLKRMCQRKVKKEEPDK